MTINNKNIFLTCIFLQFDIESNNPKYFICVLNNEHGDEEVYLNTIIKQNVNLNSNKQILDNNALFIKDFLNQYYFLYGLIYDYTESFNFEGYNVLVVRKTFVKEIQTNEESLIIPFINPNPLTRNQIDNNGSYSANDNLSNISDNLLCLNTNITPKLLEEVASNAFLPIYPNEKINWNQIPVDLRAKINGLYDEHNLLNQFTGKEGPSYFNMIARAFWDWADGY